MESTSKPQADLLIRGGTVLTCIPRGDDQIGRIPDGAVAIAGERILAVGTRAEVAAQADVSQARVLDATGQVAAPGFVDSHTHLVFGGSRVQEYAARMTRSAAEVRAMGIPTGIQATMSMTRAASDEELVAQTAARLAGMFRAGTTTVEIKSGYGLTLEDELKMLRVIRRVKKDSPATIKATFLGAHAVGRAFKGRQNEYVNLVCEEMIPAVAAEGLAEYVDVFCDEGFFTVDETDRILSAGERYGLIPKIHANELACSGGVQVAVKHNALSVDHLERTTDAEIEALRDSRTMPTMLPGSSFFLGIPYGRAKEYVSAGLGIAIASDYNPGSSPSGDMRFVMALGCIRMRLTPAQSFNACTLNSAYAMGVAEELGSVTVGKLANLIVTKPVPSLAYIPYCHQTPFIAKVLLRGTHIC